MLIDETGSQLQGDIGHTWAPRGQTPTITVTSQRKHLSIIGGITPQGNLFSQKWLGSINGFLFMLFLKYLLQQIPGQAPIVIVVDNSPIHKSALIRNFVAQNPRLELIYTPTYAPESNPIEWLWAWVKHQLQATSFPNANALAASWKSKLASARKTTGLIQAFFRDSLLAPLCP